MTADTARVVGGCLIGAAVGIIGLPEWWRMISVDCLLIGGIYLLTLSSFR